MVKHELSREFIKMLQKRLREINPNITMEEAWDFYKDLNKDIIDFVNDAPNKRVPLAGVHTLEVIECKPSKSMESKGYEKDYRFRVRQSTTMSRYLNDLNK